MIRLTGLVAALAVTACATAAPNEGSITEDRVTVSDGAGSRIADFTITRDDHVQSVVLDAPRDAVWPLLGSVYQEIGLPAPATDRSSWTAAVQNHGAMRRIGSERMSRLMDCGRSMDGDNADTHRIRLSVRTWLVQVGTTTQVNTRVEADATSVEGRAGSMTCTSKGWLEQRILDTLRARIAAG